MRDNLGLWDGIPLGFGWAARRLRRDFAAAGVVFSRQYFQRAQSQICETEITSRSGKSGRGLPQSETLTRFSSAPRTARSVLDCASPLALLDGDTKERAG